MSARPVLIMAGGTGGHVFPGLAVAEVLRQRDIPVRWLGTAAGLEARVVPAAGIPLHHLDIRGLRGSGWRRWLGAPLVLARALWQAWRVLARVRPAVVLSMGGFAAGPGGLMAWLLRYPLVIHEQNAIPGLTNRILARLGGEVLCAFDHTFPTRVGARVIGNPVRADIASLATPEARLQARQGEAVQLLILGGSQGARSINQMVPGALLQLDRATQPKVLHQCGQAHLEEARLAWRDYAGEVEVTPFIEDMAAAYARADVVLARAGALTVAELSAAGVPAVLVPYPYAVDDHQTHNAAPLVAAGAAVLLPQSQLTAERLAETLAPLLTDGERRRAMALAGRALARPDAATALADALIQAGGVR